MAAVFRAVFGYCFLVLMVRVAGRSPGKQRTPADFVVIFFMGGLTLTSMVGDRSLTNAITIVISIAATHYVISKLKQRYPFVGRIVDGTPVVLYENGMWHEETMKQTSIHEADVLAGARDEGLRGLDEIKYVILERNGQISLIQREAPA